MYSHLSSLVRLKQTLVHFPLWCGSFGQVWIQQSHSGAHKQPNRDPAEEVVSVRIQTNSCTVRLRWEYELPSIRPNCRKHAQKHSLRIYCCCLHFNCLFLNCNALICVQIMSFCDHRAHSNDMSALNWLKLATKPQQKLQWICLGEIVRRNLNYLLINKCFVSRCHKDEVKNPDSPSPHWTLL